jgi:hypothetical protein
MRNPGYAAAPPRVQTGRVDSLSLAKALLERGANPNPRIAWKEIKLDRDNGTVRQPSNISTGRVTPATWARRRLPSPRSGQRTSR